MHYVAVARLSDKVMIADHMMVDSREISHKLIDDKRERVLHSGRVGQHRRLTITDRDVGTIHYESDPECIYMLMCASDYDQRTAFKLLDEVRRVFTGLFSATVISAARHSGLSATSRDAFVAVCDKYNAPQNVDKVANVALQVNDVKDVMQDNIQSVLRNQDNIETLLDQTDTMKNEANGFQRSANRAKDKMWWKNVKMQIVIVVLVLILLGGIFFAIFRNKGGGSDSGNRSEPGQSDSGAEATNSDGNRRPFHSPNP